MVTKLRAGHRMERNTAFLLGSFQYKIFFRPDASIYVKVLGLSKVSRPAVAQGISMV